MSDIRAVADKRGLFQQGTTATVLIKITDFDGTPIDPSSITCTINGPTDNNSLNEEVLAVTPFQADRGFYVAEWAVDSEQTVGIYQVTWEYTVEEDGELVEKTELQQIVVTEGFAETEIPEFYQDHNMFMREALTHHICCAQSIPIYFEQAKPSRDKKTFYFSFKRWNQSAGVKIYRNQNIVNSGVEVDYFNGKIVFDTPLMEAEVVNADYNFKWFSEEDLQRFVENGLDILNVFPPHSTYTMSDLPPKFIPVVLYRASVDALRQLIMCLQFAEPQQIFGGRDASQSALQGFSSLKENYEKDFDKLVEQKKYGPYPTTKLIVTPEYTLPGGRSRWFRYLFKG